jgi:DnaK suppressor protein
MTARTLLEPAYSARRRDRALGEVVPLGARVYCSRMTETTLAVRGDEDPWTSDETAAVRAELEDDLVRLRKELDLSAKELQDLLRDGVDGAGNDQADVGSTSLERDAEMSLAANQRVLLLQTEKALDRLGKGTYGACETCGEPIGKLRLQAFPRATLCKACKQREERR